MAIVIRFDTSLYASSRSHGINKRWGDLGLNSVHIYRPLNTLTANIGIVSRRHIRRHGVVRGADGLYERRA